MASRKVRLRLPASGRGAEVEVDGHQVASAVVSVGLDVEAGEMPRLNLSLRLQEVEVEGDMAVVVSESTHSALIALGWTPPEGRNALARS